MRKSSASKWRFTFKTGVKLIVQGEPEPEYSNVYIIMIIYIIIIIIIIISVTLIGATCMNKEYKFLRSSNFLRSVTTEPM